MTRGGSGVPARVGEGGHWRGVHATDWSGQRLIGLGLYSLVLLPGDRLCRQHNTRPREAASDGKAQSCGDSRDGPSSSVGQTVPRSQWAVGASRGLIARTLGRPRPNRVTLATREAQPGHESAAAAAAPVKTRTRQSRPTASPAPPRKRTLPAREPFHGAAARGGGGGVQLRRRPAGARAPAREAGSGRTHCACVRAGRGRGRRQLTEAAAASGDRRRVASLSAVGGLDAGPAEPWRPPSARSAGR